MLDTAFIITYPKLKSNTENILLLKIPTSFYHSVTWSFPHQLHSAHLSQVTVQLLINPRWTYGHADLLTNYILVRTNNPDYENKLAIQSVMLLFLIHGLFTILTANESDRCNSRLNANL